MLRANDARCLRTRCLRWGRLIREYKALVIREYKTLVSLSRRTDALPSNIHFDHSRRYCLSLSPPPSDPPTQSTKPISPLSANIARRHHRSTPITPLTLAPSNAVTPLTSSFIRGPVSISGAATPSVGDFRLQFSRPPSSPDARSVGPRSVPR